MLHCTGTNVGTQYRTVIYYHNQEQKKIVNDCLKDRAKKLALRADQSYFTELTVDAKEAEEFYQAEEYHQQYLQKKG